MTKRNLSKKQVLTNLVSAQHAANNAFMGVVVAIIFTACSAPSTRVLHQPAHPVTQDAASQLAKPMWSAIQTPPQELARDALALIDKNRADYQEAETLRTVYGDRAQLRFVTRHGLSATGKALLAQLTAAGDHALDPEDYQVNAIDRLRQSKPFVSVALRVELALADGLTHFARDMCRGNTKAAELVAKQRQDIADSSDNLPSPQPLVLSDRETFIRKQLIADLRSISNKQSLEQLFSDLTPRHPQYEKLVAALAQYRAIANAGGWQRVANRPRLRRGLTHDAVMQLKRRLVTEGFYQKPVNAHFDEALVAAVKRYQRAHQLTPTGRIDRATRHQLNVPVDTRIAAIELTLQRWRESGIGNEPYYAFINIPDYHFELWNNGNRLLRHRIVVGKSYGTTCDEKTRRRVLEYATPEQSAFIKHLVFSPFWNVTRDIKEQELDVELAKDPLYYKRNGFEVIEDGSSTRVRELPGPHNALGFVKFIFPNPHNTYLHDTPKKKLFARTKRAYSHGCMRLQQPLTVAKQILQHDGQWDETAFSNLHTRWQRMHVRRLRHNWNPDLYHSYVNRAHRLERTVALEQPVPIHVEYYTVRVDDSGNVHFLGDIYRRDRMRRLGYQGARCVPERLLAKKRFEQAIETVAELEQQANDLQSCAQNATNLASALRNASRDPKAKRTARRLQKLATLELDHSRSVDHIRRQHAALTVRRLETDGEWNRTLVRDAMRIHRLVEGLKKLTRQATKTCETAHRVAERLGIVDNTSLRIAGAAQAPTSTLVTQNTIQGG